ncbi:MAG: AraC family transcriptional regulator [Flammeovirgaceae bacterium]
MKALPFKIPITANEAFFIQIDQQPYLYDALHQHPEIQITLMVKGTGTLFLGNYIGEFRPGDVFIIGSNVPHVFKNDEEYYQGHETLEAHAITVFIDFQQFVSHYLNTPEMREIQDFFLGTKRCLKLSNEIDSTFSGLMDGIEYLKGLSKTIRVLQLVELLAAREDYELLISESIDYNVQESEGKRLNEIISFALKEYQRPINLNEVADIANMTPPSFCRFFKQRTRKSFVTFLTELRVHQACKLLTEKDLSILDIALTSGFNNLSHFNRKFRNITGLTPSAFRKAHKKL